MSGVIFGFTNPYETGTVETKKCECGCDVYFDADQTIVHKVTSEVISFDCLDYYNELIEKERIENGGEASGEGVEKIP